MADIKSDASVNKCSLCFITLTCIVEEQFANSIMHDQNLSFKVCKTYTIVIFDQACLKHKIFQHNKYMFSYNNTITSA